MATATPPEALGVVDDVALTSTIQAKVESGEITNEEAKLIVDKTSAALISAPPSPECAIEPATSPALPTALDVPKDGPIHAAILAAEAKAAEAEAKARAALEALNQAEAKAVEAEAKVKAEEERRRLAESRAIEAEARVAAAEEARHRAESSVSAPPAAEEVTPKEQVEATTEGEQEASNPQISSDLMEIVSTQNSQTTSVPETLAKPREPLASEMTDNEPLPSRETQNTHPKDAGSNDAATFEVAETPPSPPSVNASEPALDVSPAGAGHDALVATGSATPVDSAESIADEEPTSAEPVDTKLQGTESQGDVQSASLTAVRPADLATKSTRRRIQNSFKKFGGRLQPMVSNLDTCEEDEDVAPATDVFADESPVSHAPSSTRRRKTGLDDEALSRVRATRAAFSQSDEAPSAAEPAPRGLASRRLSGLDDKDQEAIRIRIRTMSIEQEKKEESTPASALGRLSIPAEERSSPSPARLAIPEGSVKSVGNFWENVAERQGPMDPPERLNARRTSRQLAAIVVQEAKLASEQAMRRLSMSRRRRKSTSQRSSTSAAPADDTATKVGELEGLGDGAGAAVGYFDALVLERFVVLEEQAQQIDKSVSEHVQMFRQAVILQRDFLRLVCQVDQEHDETTRVVEESEENIESAQAYVAGLPGSLASLPLCRVVCDAAEALAWICVECDNTAAYVEERVERVRSAATDVRAACGPAGEQWYRQLLLLLEGLHRIVAKFHAPTIRWRKDPPPCDWYLRQYGSMPKAASEAERHAYELQRCAFDARMKKLSDQTAVLSPREHLGYSPIKKLGAGAFGQVVLVTGDSETLFACKAMAKIGVIDSLQAEHALNERNILFGSECPHIVKLHDHCQDSASLYMVLEFCAGGELLQILKKAKNGCLTESQTRFCAGQMTAAVDYLHNLDIVFRDLKPENVLLDEKGNLRLADFGFAKRIIRTADEAVTYTMCGTPEYMAPELIVNNGHTVAVDWWALGVFVYEIRSGCTPFKSRSEYETYYKISSADFKFPGYPEFTADEKDFVGKLLTVEVDHRLGGADGGVQVFAHQYFEETDIDALRAQTIPSPLLAFVKVAATDRVDSEVEEAAACLQWKGEGDDDFGCTFCQF